MKADPKTEKRSKGKTLRAYVGLLQAIPAAHAIGYCVSHEIITGLSAFLAIMLLVDWVVICARRYLG